MSPRPWIEWTVAALVLGALLASAADKPMGFDEGIWFHVARAWVDDGVPPYQGPIENKSPGIYYVFALSYLAAGVGETLPRAAGVAAVLGACLACYVLARRLAGREAGLAAALIAGLVMASPGLDGADTSATESFMVFASTVAIARAGSASAREGRHRRRAMLQSGAALGAAVAFKQIAVVTAPALVAFAWALTPEQARTGRRVAADAAWMTLGAVAMTAASLAPLWVAGVSPSEYFEGAWLILFDPGSGFPAPKPALDRLATHNVWLTSPLAVLVLGAAAFLVLRQRLRRRVPWGPLALWIVLDSFGALAARTFFPHHFKQLVPAMAVAGGILISEAIDAAATRPWGRHARGAALACVALLLLPYSSIVHRVVGPSRDRARADQLEVAGWIRRHSEPGDGVFTFVGGGLIQAASERPSPTRYFNRNFIKTDAAVSTVRHDLRARPPRIIVIEHKVPVWLQDDLDHCCTLVHTVAKYFLIFERRRLER